MWATLRETRIFNVRLTAGKRGEERERKGGGHSHPCWSACRHRFVAHRCYLLAMSRRGGGGKERKEKKKGKRERDESASTCFGGAPAKGRKRRKKKRRAWQTQHRVRVPPLHFLY